jgi:hypothetical protein
MHNTPVQMSMWYILMYVTTNIHTQAYLRDVSFSMHDLTTSTTSTQRRAGDWESGAFDSMNKDGTVAANAPLTLSGTSERPEQAQPTDPTDHIGRRASVAYKSAPGPRRQQLAEQTLWETPLEQVKALPKAKQIAWAKHVLEQSDEQRLLDVPLAAVKWLSPSDQRKWALAIVRNHGKV